jgi:hypothetical protein
MGRSSHNKEEDYDERRVVETPLKLVENVRSLMAELQIFKENNDRIIKDKRRKLK